MFSSSSGTCLSRLAALQPSGRRVQKSGQILSLISRADFSRLSLNHIPWTRRVTQRCTRVETRQQRSIKDSIMRFDLGFFGKMPRIAVPTIKTGRHKRRESTPPPPYQPFEESESEKTTDKLRRLSHDFSTLTLQKREKIMDRFFKQREELPPPKSEVPHLILMDIAPPGAAPEYYRGEWLACLEFTTRDLSRLMTEGFFWDEGNVVAEEGYFVSEEQELRLYEQQFGFQHARVYNCCSRGGDGPQWTGTIRVSARSLGVLSEFEIGMLSVDLVFRMEASCGSGGNRQRVYQYRVQEEERNFNAWYDGAVLEGWWPWPRSAVSDGE